MTNASPRPLLVLLPGMDGTGLMFEPFLNELKDFDTLVVSYPAALTSYAACLHFARLQLPANRPFLLLGESFSGPVALALAAERPASLVGLVLCGTFARNPHPGLAWLTPLLRALPPLRLPLALVRHLLLGPWATAPLLALAQTLRRTVPPLTLNNRLLAVATLDHTALLSQLRVPTLALCGSQDRLVPRVATAWLRAHLPHLDIANRQGPHWLLQARPEAAARALRDFLDRLPERSMNLEP
jgi:pimeloyl-ACP methyl ester carboxylesterase